MDVGRHRFGEFFGSRTEHLIISDVFRFIYFCSDPRPFLLKVADLRFGEDFHFRQGIAGLLNIERIRIAASEIVVDFEIVSAFFKIVIVMVMVLTAFPLLFK